MMKKMMILGLAILLLFPIMSAQSDTSYIFKQGQDATLQIPVKTVNGLACTTCTCDMTINYPNGTLLVDNQAATMSNGFASYDLNENQTATLGEHIVDLTCDDGTNGGSSQFSYEITLTGKPTPEGIPVVMGIIVFVIFGMAWFFLFLSTQMNQPAMKIFFLLFSLVLIGASLLLGISFVQDNNLTESISDTMGTLFWIIGSVIFLMFTYIAIRQFVAVMDSVNENRGLRMGSQFNQGVGRNMMGYDPRRAY